MIVKKNRILVFDHLYPITDNIKTQFIQLKGKHYKNLKPNPGWTFPIDKLNELENILHIFSDNFSCCIKDETPLSNEIDETEKDETLLSNEMIDETEKDKTPLSNEMIDETEKDENISPKKILTPIKRQKKKIKDPKTSSIQFIVNEYKYDIPITFYEHFKDYIIQIHS